MAQLEALAGRAVALAQHLAGLPLGVHGGDAGADRPGRERVDLGRVAERRPGQAGARHGVEPAAQPVRPAAAHRFDRRVRAGSSSSMMPLP